MPNWCQNRVRVQALCDNELSSKEFQTLMEKIGMLDSNLTVSFSEFLDVGEIYINDYCEKDLLDIEFDTAWNPPTDGFKALGLKFPNLVFSVQYEEPGMGLIGVMRAAGEKFEDKRIGW